MQIDARRKVTRPQDAQVGGSASWASQEKKRRNGWVAEIAWANVILATVGLLLELLLALWAGLLGYGCGSDCWACWVRSSLVLVLQKGLEWA